MTLMGSTGVAGWGVMTVLLLASTEAGAEGGVEREGMREERPIPGTPTEAGLEEEFRRFRETLRASPEYREHDAATHFLLGEQLAHRGDVNGAKEEFRLAIRLNPDFADAYRALGQVLLDHHEYVDAVLALQGGVRLRPRDGDVLYWLGRAHMGAGNLADAEIALDQAARLKPDEAEMYANIGLVRMAQGKVEAARQALEQALALRPDRADVHQLMETLREFSHDPLAVQRAARAMLATVFSRE